MAAKKAIRNLFLFLDRVSGPDIGPLDERILNRLFGIEAESVVEFKASPAFIPRVWAGIDAHKSARSSWAYYLVDWSPRLAAATMVLTALVALSHWMTMEPDSGSVALDSSYEDVLIRNAMDQSDGAIFVLAENGE